MLVIGKEQAVQAGHRFLAALHLEEYDLQYSYFYLPESELLYFSVTWNSRDLYISWVLPA